MSTGPSLSQEILDQTAQIVTKTQSVRSSALDVALYDAVKFFIDSRPDSENVDVVEDGERTDEKDQVASRSGSSKIASAKGGSEESDETIARFEALALAVLASPLDAWREPERARKSRVDLALAVAKGHPPQRRLQNPAALAAILKPWLAEERSRPLREDLDRALQACNR